MPIDLRRDQCYNFTCTSLFFSHGETDSNVQRRIVRDSNLTALGREQAQCLADRVKDVPFAAIYTSDLGRAIATARIIAGQRDLEIQPMAELREASWGDWEGLTVDEIISTSPDLWARLVARWSETSEDADEDSTSLIPNAETTDQVIARIASALQTIRSSHPSEDEWVGIVGHGGSTRYMLTLALGMPARSVERIHLDNASLSHIHYMHARPAVVKAINDTGHLTWHPWTTTG